MTSDFEQRGPEIAELARKLGVRHEADLLALLQRSDQDVSTVGEACGLAGKLALDGAVPELVRILREHPEPLAYWSAALALAPIPGPHVTEALISLLQPGSDDDRCYAAANALWNRRDPAAEDALLAVLQDEGRSERARDQAAEALGMVAPRSSERTLVALCEASRHPSVWIRMGALCALSLWLGEDEQGNPPDPRAVQAFRDRKDDHDEYFRHRIDGLD